MEKRIYQLIVGCTLAGLALGAVACGDDKDDDKEVSEAALKADCKVISDACHHVDDGEGEAAECHELAHENDTGDCTAAKDRCVTACEEHEASEGGEHTH